MSDLSEQAKREWKAAAASATLREDFLLLERLARQEQAALTLDDYLRFLTSVSQFAPARASTWEPMIFTIARI